MALIYDIWSYKIQLIPILLSILLFEVPALIRRLRKIYYVPIYFSVFPLREVNQDLSIYLAEDAFYGIGEQLSEKEAEQLRKKIINTSIISMLISALFCPMLVGFLPAFYLHKSTFMEFAFLLIIYKSVALALSLYRFHFFTVGTRKNQLLLLLIYVSYLGVILEVLRSSYRWAEAYVNSGQWVDMISDLSSFIFGRAIIGIILLGLLTRIFFSFVMDREVTRHDPSRD